MKNINIYTYASFLLVCIVLTLLWFVLVVVFYCCFISLFFSLAH